MSYICYNCGKEIISGCHYLKCDKSQITKDEKIYKHYQHNFRKIEFLFDKNLFQEKYNKLSFPDFKKIYNIDSQVIYFFARYYNIKTRTISEARKQFQYKVEKTNLAKYGHKNVLGTGTIISKKRDETVKNKYGVKNVFQIKEVVEKIQNNEEYKKNKSVRAKKVWANKTEIERENWLNRSIHSNVGLIKARGYTVSSLEYEIRKQLELLEINYQCQFFVKINNKKRYFYDIFIKELNLIIEINGDYWHANPKIYNENDIIFFKFGQITAKDIWEKNKEKIDYARSLGFSILILWEDEIKNQNNLLEFVKNKIYENCTNQINQEN